jgi:hypothetical protein
MPRPNLHFHQVATNGQLVDARIHIANTQAWQARQTGDLRNNINNNRANRQNHELHVEQARRSSVSRFGLTCFGLVVRGEPYPMGSMALMTLKSTTPPSNLGFVSMHTPWPWESPVTLSYSPLGICP